MASWVRIAPVIPCAGSKPVITDQWRTVGVWNFNPAVSDELALRSSFIATADPGTVGEVRFRVVETGEATVPVLVDGPTGPVLNEYVELTDSGTSVHVIVEARRVEGAGGVRVIEAAASQAPATLAATGPQFRTRPEITGAARYGGTLTATPPVVVGYPAPVLTYLWIVAGYIDTGATGNTFDLDDPAYVGEFVQVEAVAINDVTVSTARSDLIGPVLGAPSPDEVVGITVNGVGDGGLVDLSGPVTLHAPFSSPEPADEPVSLAIRFRESGSMTWGYVNLTTGGGGVEGSEVFNDLASLGVPGSQTVIVPAGIFSNGKTWEVNARYTGSFGTAGAYDSDIEVTGSARPTFTMIAPAEEIDASSPTLAAVYADPEGDAQTARRWIVATAEAAAAAGYQPDDLDPAGVAWDSDWIAGAGEEDPVPVQLVNGEAYVAFGQAEQTGGQTSEWTYTTFTVAVPTAPAPLLDLSVGAGTVTLQVTSTANQLTLDSAVSSDADVADGWTPTGGSVVLNPVGPALDVTATGDGDVDLESDVDAWVVEGERLGLYADVQLVDGEGREWVWEVDWLDASNNVLSTDTSPAVAELPVAPPTPAPLREFTLQRASTSAFADATALAGASITGDVAIRLDPVDTDVNAEIDQVRFYYRIGNGSFVLYSTDTGAPWEMESGGLVPFSIWPGNGARTVRAVVDFNDGTSMNVDASFTTSTVTPGEFTPTANTLWYPTNLPGGDVNFQRVAADRLQVVSSIGDGVLPPFQGVTLRYRFIDGDYVAGGPRVEFRKDNGFHYEGAEYWAGWKLWLPADFPNPGGWGIVNGQWHMGGEASPVIAFELKASGRCEVVRRWGLSTNQPQQSSRAVVLNSIPRGKVTTFKWHIRASKGANGLTELWIDGAKVFSQSGPNRYSNKSDGDTTDFKYGRYGPNQGAEARLWAGAFIFSLAQSEVDAVLAGTP